MDWFFSLLDFIITFKFLIITGTAMSVVIITKENSTHLAIKTGGGAFSISLGSESKTDQQRHKHKLSATTTNNGEKCMFWRSMLTYFLVGFGLVLFAFWWRTQLEAF